MGFLRRFLPIFFLPLFVFLLPSRLAAQFSFTTFGPGDSLCRVGDVQLLPGGVLRITPDAPFRRGAVWHRRKQQVAAGFTTKFLFRMGKTGSEQQADGLALVIQNADSCAIGNYAQGIGYEGIPNSIAIEFDTWYNEGVDPNNNHISVHSRGQAPNRADFAGAIATHNDVPVLGLGVPHNIIVDYDGELLRVYVGECREPLFSVAINLDSLLRLDSGRAWVGITSATGLNHQDHELFSWEFESTDKTVSQKCLGDSVILEGPRGFADYRWATGETTRTITVHQSGVYRLYVSGSLLCPDEETEYVFDVSVTPRTFAPHIFPRSPVILCRGDSAVLTVLTGPYTDDTFLWSTGDTTRSITVNRSGRYSVVLSDPNGCEYHLDTVQVFVRPPPEPNILPGDSIFLCTDDSVRLWVPDVFATYRWSTGESGNEITVSEAGVYTLAVTDADGCEGYDTAVVAMPDAVSLTRDTVVCAGEHVQLTASGRMEYRWSPAEGLSCTDCPNPIASPTATTVYTVRGTNNGGCASERRVTVTVLPAQADAGADTVLCLGDTLRLNGRGDGQGNNLYLWTPTTQISCSDCPDPLVYPRRSTTYYLQVANGNGCVALDSVRITVQSGDNIVASGDTGICVGGSARLSAIGGRDYRWSPGGSLSCTDCPEPVATPKTTTTYYVIGTSDAEQCASIDSVVVTVNAVPVIDAGADTAICAGTGLRLVATGGMTYRWDASPDLSCLDCPDPIALPLQTTTYYVTGFGAEGCERRDSVRVRVYPVPDADAGDDREICFGDTVRLSGGDAVRWLWEPPEGLSCTDCRNPLASPLNTTTYRLRVWSADGCAGSDSVRIIVREEPEIIRLRIGRNYGGRTGEGVEIAIERTDDVGATDIRDLELLLQYDPNVLKIDTGSVARLLSGTILAGWNVELGEAGTGVLAVHLTAPFGVTLTGKGTLLRFAGQLFLGSARGTELSFSGGTKSRCFVFETEAGYAQADSICGLNFRLIELTSEKYVAPIVYPNPASDRIRFEFALGLDGPTRLDVFDPLGNHVGLIVESFLKAGRYTVEWDVGTMPSGMYRYRLTSGHWTGGGAAWIMR